MYKTEFLG